MIRRLFRRAFGIYSPSLAAIGREPDLTLARKAAARGDWNAAACVVSYELGPAFMHGVCQGLADGLSVDIAGGVVGVARPVRIGPPSGGE